jgi:glycerol-3-phosphate acyltransferase PlsY
LGSIPEAWLLARWITGRDLRQMGSGNVGVMNTALSVARWAGLLVFLTEIAKGLLSVIAPRLLSGSDKIISLCVIAVVIGTRWSIWLRFKGGRGNTAGMSAFLLISIPTLGIALVLWVLARLVLKRSFIATRVTILSLPLIFGVVTRSWWFVLTGLVLCAIYLGAQQPESDDHRIIQQYWSSFWSFITSPPRRGK